MQIKEIGAKDSRFFHLLTANEYDRVIVNDIPNVCFGNIGNKKDYTFVIPSFLDMETVISYFDIFRGLWDFSYNILPKEEMDGISFGNKSQVKNYWEIKIECPLKYKELVIVGNLLKGINEWPWYLKFIYINKGFSAKTLLKDIKQAYDHVADTFQEPYSDHMPWKILEEMDTFPSLVELKKNLYNNCPNKDIWNHCLRVE